MTRERDGYYIGYVKKSNKADPSDSPCSRPPEIRMWEAVIFRAVWDYKHFWEAGRDSLEKRNLAKKAQVWVSVNPQLPRPGDFVWCCQECFPDNSAWVIKKLRQVLSLPLPPRISFVPDHVRIQRNRMMKRYPC